MIPKYEQFMLPLLKFLEDGKERAVSETYDAMAVEFSLSEKEKRELLPSGRQPLFKNRVAWARTYLNKAGLLISHKRAYCQITDEGLKALAEKPVEITSKDLRRYESFARFVKTSKPKQDREQKAAKVEVSDQSPEEILEYAHQSLHDDLKEELLGIVKSCSPEFFENLVVDLLITMGYGGSRKEAGQAMGKSGDGGIDGLINEDKLGLDVIYIQAKRWENTVPVKEIRDFTGALAAKKAKKGIFITTSDFPNSVYDIVSQVEYKIILIDGARLANLMIEHSVGVSTVSTYYIKTLDSDYFEEA